MTDAEALLLREFPDFDLAALPAIPEGFRCAAWHNDVCPLWYESADGGKAGVLMLAVDYVCDDLREFPGGCRFGLHITSPRSHSMVEPVALFGSDDWSDIEAAVRLARFIRDDARLGFHPDTRGADYDPPLAPERAAQVDSDVNAVAARTDVVEFGLTIFKAMGWTA